MAFKGVLCTWGRDLNVLIMKKRVLIMRLHEEINFVGIDEQKRSKKEMNQDQISSI